MTDVANMPILDGHEPFEDPEPARKVVTYDGWGRYKLPDPNTGRERGFTRVTTIASTLEDQYHLNLWGKRKTLEGLVLERGLLAQAAHVFREFGQDPQEREAKKRLDAIAKSACDIAGSSSGAETGTALHAITEDHNQGRFHEAGQEADRRGLSANMRAYVNTLAREEITVLPEFMERLVFVPQLDAVGRLDNLTREKWAALLRVFDLKSQKTMDFGAMKIAIQLAMYANAEAMFNEETWQWEEMPAVDKEIATVCWLPVMEGEEEKVCQLYDVDLAHGWRWAKAAYQTRQWRKVNPLSVRAPRPTLKAVVSSGPVTLAPVVGIETAKSAVQEESRAVAETGTTGLKSGLDWEARFRQARTHDELRAAGRECKEAGELTENLKELGKKLGAKLPA